MLEKIKERIIDVSKDISFQCFEYFNNKNIFDKFRIYLLNFENNLMNNIENDKNITNDNGIEEDLFNANNINTIGSKVNTNDSSINQPKEENIISKGNKLISP